MKGLTAKLCYMVLFYRMYLVLFQMLRKVINLILFQF